MSHCFKCQIAFQHGEPRVGVGPDKFSHFDCYLKHVREIKSANENPNDKEKKSWLNRFLGL